MASVPLLLSWKTKRRDIDMLKRTFRVYALSLAGAALLLGGATVSAGAMTLPSPGAVTEQATPAIVTGGDATAKVEQVWWRGRGYGWRGRGWHRGYGWRRGYGWGRYGWRGYGWRGYYGAGRWCYFHPYAC
jgi:hypothetical protein